MSNIELLNKCQNLQELSDLTVRLNIRTCSWGGWTFFIKQHSDSLSSNMLIQKLDSLFLNSIKNRNTAALTLKITGRIHRLNDKGRALINPWFMILLTFIMDWLENLNHNPQDLLNKIEERAQSFLVVPQNPDYLKHDQESLSEGILDDVSDLEPGEPLKSGNPSKAHAKRSGDFIAQNVKLDFAAALKKELEKYPAVSCKPSTTSSLFSLNHKGFGKSSIFDKDALQSQLGNGELGDLFTTPGIQKFDVAIHSELFTLLCDYLNEGDVPKTISQLDEKHLIDFYETAHQMVIPRLEIQCALEILKRISASMWKDETLLLPYSQFNS